MSTSVPQGRIRGHWKCGQKGGEIKRDFAEVLHGGGDKRGEVSRESPLVQWTSL